jgi:tRNA modification GTPase
MTDTAPIAAIATAPGMSAIGVVRVSGPNLAVFIQSLIGAKLSPRRAMLSRFRDAQGEIIDVGIALFFPAPRSYTGEDVLELQAHGGPVVLQQLLKRCLELGARPAQPGEFTQRAYLNDKLDLAQAESVADLIGAATAEAARGAVRSLQGAFSREIEKLVRELIDLRALVEATLDFPEEEIDFLKQAEFAERLARVRGYLEKVLATSRQGRLLRDGVHIVLAGPPNVGKSSLINRLSNEEVAIVTEIPGTTRDVIRQSIDIAGVPVHVIDTAGLRDTQDPVERIGVERTWSAIKAADLLLLIVDATIGEGDADEAVRRQLPPGLPRITILNKSDLLGGAKAGGLSEGRERIWLSAKTGAGVDLLRSAILESVGWSSQGEGLFMARERHLQALERAKGHLTEAVEMRLGLEILAEELRLAQEALIGITGEFTADDLLGEIFSRFCIGK